MKIFIVFSITFTCAFLENFVSNANPLPYEAIFNFGDSISDTGNADKTHPPFPGDSPYGSTYFKHPAGRLSNGRLIIDFIAEAYGLPFLPAYLNLTKNQDIKKGVNFAFAGATALDFEYFIRKGVDKPATDNSLSVQIGWFKKFKPSLCKSKEECDNFFKKSLFLVGEIGGNDVMAHISYKDVIGLRELVPPMVEAITNATSALIEEGAVELVVPGNFPIGCISGILTMVNSTKKDEYDQFGCLIAYNTFIEYFNGQLKQAIETLRQKHPQAKIMYFDYYNDAKRLFQAPQQYDYLVETQESMSRDSTACGGEDLPRWSLIALSRREVVSSGQSEVVGQELGGLSCFDCESGAIPALVPLLWCSDPSTEEDVTALLNLSLLEDNKLLITNDRTLVL
ncbi:SGNH hydrolase superfamily [Sesbania bispinosa]|nr:SGNH hydrolase superfamily [Sesbania bispinosa]